MKVVVNKCFGGFGISKKAAEYMEKLGNKRAKAELDDWRKEKEYIDEFLKTGKWNKECENHSFLEIDAKYRGEPTFHGYGYVDGFDGGYSRTDEHLIKAVEHLGKKANGNNAQLKIIEIPDDIEWEIDEYDGIETIHEKHRSW